MSSNARAAYDRAASNYQQSFSWRSALRLFSVDAPQWSLATRGARGANPVVVELGCGTGRLLKRLPTGTLGIDSSAAMAQVARRRGLSVAVADMELLPIQSDSVDVAVSGNGSLRYADRGKVFSELFRVLRPGGRFSFHLYARRPWTLGSCVRRRPLDLGAPNLEDVPTLERELRDRGLYLDRVVATLDLPLAPWVISLRGLPGALGPHLTFVGRCAADKTREQARMAVRARLRAGARVEVGIAGHSMAPLLEVGDRVAILPNAPVRRGDWVAIDGYESLVIHRLIARVPAPGGSWYLHRGTNGGGIGRARLGQLLGRAELVQKLTPRPAAPRASELT